MPGIVLDVRDTKMNITCSLLSSNSVCCGYWVQIAGRKWEVVNNIFYKYVKCYATGIIQVLCKNMKGFFSLP